VRKLATVKKKTPPRLASLSAEGAWKIDVAPTAMVPLDPPHCW